MTFGLRRSWNDPCRAGFRFGLTTMSMIRRILLSMALLGILMVGAVSPIEANDYPKTLSHQETTWLQSISDTPIRYVIPPKFIPVSFIKDGAADGIVKSYIEILQNRLGLTFQLLNVSFKEGLDLAQKGEVDLFPCLAQNSDRESFLTFTQKPYIAFQLVIVAQKGGEAIRSIQDLDGKRVAVDKNLVAYSKLKNEHSDLNIEFVFVKTNPNALKAVHLSQADAALSSSAVAGYLIAENGWNNLKIAANTGWPEVRMKMGVKKEWPLLISILDKTLAEIPDAKRMEISNQWIPVNIEHGFDSVYVLKRILPVIGGLGAIALVIALFLMLMIKKNRQLREAEQQIQAAYIELEAAMATAEAASKAKSQFLDNSGQGFLSFGESMLVDAEYSRECELIFEKPIAGTGICDLLFSNEDHDAAAKALFEKTVKLALNEPLDLKQELYLSLLKPYYNIASNGPVESSDKTKHESTRTAKNRFQTKYIKAEYHRIHGPKMMLILTDLTREKQLEQDVENERQRLKFVVSTLRDAQDTLSIIEDYNSFKFQTLPEILGRFSENRDEEDIDTQVILSDIYRSVHTFKGLFAQQGFISLPEWLHAMENRLSALLLHDAPSMEDLEPFIVAFQDETLLEKDLAVIREVLGEDLMARNELMMIPREAAIKMEEMARKLLNGAEPLTLPGAAAPHTGDAMGDDTVLRQLLVKVSQIRYVTLKSLLQPHVEGVLRYARQVGKRIAPFQVEGDAVLVDPERFSTFAKSLVHVFRNALDHGIESPDERHKADKPESAVIQCSVRKVDGPMERFKISITDDGRGIDFYAIEGRAVQRNLMSLHEVKQASDEALINLIFSSGFSTAGSVSALSGRGVGLNAVKHEVERLNGQIEVKTDTNRGTQFIFTIPL